MAKKHSVIWGHKTDTQTPTAIGCAVFPSNNAKDILIGTELSVHMMSFWSDCHFILLVVNHVLHLVSGFFYWDIHGTSGKVWTDLSTLQVLTFPAEWGVVVEKVGCSQLLSCLSSNQLLPQRHSPNLNFPIKSNPWHTLATPDTMSCERGRSEWTQITAAKFSKDSGPLPSLLPLPLLFLLFYLPLLSQLHRGHLFPLSSISRWQDMRRVESGQRHDHLSARQYGGLLSALNLACCRVIIQDKTKIEAAGT